MSSCVITRHFMATRSPSQNPFINPDLPSFADLIGRISADGKLPVLIKRNWVWGLRAVARALAKDPSAIPAHPEFLRRQMKRAAPQSIGIGRAAWNNARSFCGRALEWQGFVLMPAHYHAPLTPDWAALRAMLNNIA